MNDHLDECPEVFIDCYGTLCDCEYSHFCICDALRACEARVTALATPESVSQANYWYEQGQQDFLKAAVQRVEALPHSLECVTRDAHYRRPCNCLHGDALDAIKGDQP